MQVKSFGQVLFNVLCRPWLWMALGLHGWVLSLPIPPAPKPSQPVEVIEIPLTQIVPSTAPAVEPPPTVARSPVPTPAYQPVQPSLAQPPVNPPIPQALPPSPEPVTLASPEPSPIPSPEPSPIPSLEPSPSPLPQPWSSFPQVEGAQAGCHASESCWQTADTQWRSLATSLRQTLQMQGYSLEELPLDEDTGRRIYRVSKPNEIPYYLNLVSTREGTVYFLTEQPMTAEALNQVSGS